TRISVRWSDALRGPRNRRGGCRTARGRARAVFETNECPDRSVSPRAWRRRHRLSGAEHARAARDGAARVPVDALEDRLMSFLAPLFLAATAAAAVPVVLHLLERHTDRRVRFAAVALLRDAPVEHAARRRLRQWLLLALRVAALVLLAVVFARPFFPAASARGARLTVV